MKAAFSETALVELPGTLGGRMQPLDELAALPGEVRQLALLVEVDGHLDSDVAHVHHQVTRPRRDARGEETETVTLVCGFYINPMLFDSEMSGSVFANRIELYDALRHNELDPVEALHSTLASLKPATIGRLLGPVS